MSVSSTGASVYELKRFTNSRDKDFIKALKIYLENTDHLIITDTNEIVYGLDFYNSKFPDADFTVVGLYLNGLLIGFGQFIFFKKEKLTFIDYLVIEKTYRKNNTFYEFLEKIREYFIKMEYYPLYTIAEVSTQYETKEEDYLPKTKYLIRLLKMNNFGIIKAPYKQPMLGLGNYETNAQALLMLYPIEEHYRIRKETFLMILETVYFKHYMKWYEIILVNEEDIRKYSFHIHDIYRKITEQLKKVEVVEIDGYREISYEKSVPSPSKATRKALYFLLGFILMVLVFSGITHLLKSKLQMPYKYQVYILIIASIVYLAVLSTFSDKASKLLNRAIDKIIDKFT